MVNNRLLVLGDPPVSSEEHLLEVFHSHQASFILYLVVHGLTHLIEHSIVHLEEEHLFDDPHLCLVVIDVLSIKHVSNIVVYHVRPQSTWSLGTVLKRSGTLGMHWFAILTL